jgi:hypothetical protein
MIFLMAWAEQVSFFMKVAVPASETSPFLNDNKTNETINSSNKRAGMKFPERFQIPSYRGLLGHR